MPKKLMFKVDNIALSNNDSFPPGKPINRGLQGSWVSEEYLINEYQDWAERKGSKFYADVGFVPSILDVKEVEVCPHCDGIIEEER